MNKSAKQSRLKQVLNSRFYRIYFVVVVAVIAAMGVGRLWLNGVLADYEAAQPVYVAEKVANLFETADYETIYKLDTSAQDISGGDEAFYLDSMREIAGGRDVAWSEALSPGEGERRYSVTLDGDRFATFSLVPSGETTRYGNTVWKLGSVSTLVQVEATPEPPEPTPEPTPTPPAGPECRVRVPNGCVVTVDGVELSGENAAVTSVPVMQEGFLPEGIEGLTCTEYVYIAASDAPVVEARDAEGAPLELAQSGGNLWSCPPPGDEAFREQYSDVVLSLAQRIAKVTVRDASVDSVKRYCASRSPAWAVFDNLSNRWATPHSSTAFENVVVSDFYVHSDDCFTCHVTFDFVLGTAKGSQTYPTAYTFCIVRQGGKGKLYNLMMQ